MQRPIYHITHLDNLARIIADGGLWSDRQMQKRGRFTNIGYPHIKKRRLEELFVSCHPGLYVGDFVPFYFCPRSTMLYVISKGNPRLPYQGGQQKVVHLVTTISTAVRLAGTNPWAYSDGNAGAQYTQFYRDLSLIDSVLDWNAITADRWNEPAVKEKKQAEFLVWDHFQWSGFTEIGVFDAQVAAEVRRQLPQGKTSPNVTVQPSWYY